MVVKSTLLLFTCIAASSDYNDFSVTILNPDADFGALPQYGESVNVHYIGSLPSGQEFDNSYARKKPFEFRMGEGKTIDCWDLAFKEIRYGQKARVICPPELAYGNAGIDGLIP